MQTVKVSKDWLKQIVAKNRIGHRKQFERAFEGYCTECIRVLNDNLDAFSKGKRTRLLWNEVPPEDHTKEYDRILSMLDASVDQTIILTNVEYAQYALDDWQWRERWTTSNAKYLNA